MLLCILFCLARLFFSFLYFLLLVPTIIFSSDYYLVPLVYHLHVPGCIRNLSIIDVIGNLGDGEGLSSLSTWVN